MGSPEAGARGELVHQCDKCKNKDTRGAERNKERERESERKISQNPGERVSGSHLIAFAFFLLLLLIPPRCSTGMHRVTTKQISQNGERGRGAQEKCRLYGACFRGMPGAKLENCGSSFFVFLYAPCLHRAFGSPVLRCRAVTLI